ncbi:MAG: alpha/beta fold hydrolase [Chloroflexota bacterium]|nr:MAG: alpha/beta fold hydrolase [Chloroflexota bacterium]
MLKFLRGAALCLGLIIFGVLTTTVWAAQPTTRERLAQLGGAACPGSPDFTCVTITVPLDHFNSSDTRTIDVVFGVKPASGARKGTFVYATGGPGTSGIYLADWYSAFLRRDIFERFDVIFFDQRGMGLSGGMSCYRAAAPLYQADWRADTSAREQKLKKAMQTFADDCDTEMGHPEILPYLSTEQAVEDLDAFRALLGEEKFWLYGESYATQYAQTYAHAHANHLAGMILDGTVDLTLEGIPYYTMAVQSFNDTLVATLQACAAKPKCASDFGGDPLAAYDALDKLLMAKKKQVSFPLGNGTSVPRKFDSQALNYVGIAEMYGLYSRMEFTRALAAYARDGDLIPLSRLLYISLSVDENNLEPLYDPGWSDAYYYGVECRDYGYFTGTPASRADQYIAAAKPVELSGVRLNTEIWVDMPCAYWRDASQDTTRPPHWDAAGVPTLVLNATADPITPIDSARAVYENLADGYLITQKGGPHVIWAYGRSCVDDPVYAFLLNDQMPAQRETACGGPIMNDYVPLSPANASEFSSPLEAMQSTETEINFLPEYGNWDFVTPTAVGCGRGGTLKFEPYKDQVKFSLKDCAFTNGFIMTGTGYYDFASDRFWLKVNVTGNQTCKLKYDRVGIKTTLKGKCAGSRVRTQTQTQAPELSKPEMRRVLQRHIWRSR